jgi:hypothetical protein
VATNKPGATALTNTSPSLVSIQRKLNRWELDHLRHHALDLAERLELAEQLIEAAQSTSEYWREQCFELMQELQDHGAAIGITQAGQIGVVE